MYNPISYLLLPSLYPLLTVTVDRLNMAARAPRTARKRMLYFAIFKLASEWRDFAAAEFRRWRWRGNTPLLENHAVVHISL